MKQLDQGIAGQSIIKLVIQDKPYEHQWGDIIYGNYSDRIKALTSVSQIDGLSVLKLSYIRYNKWDALKEISIIDKNDIIDLYSDSQYYDYILKQQAVGLVPIAIFGTNLDKYIVDMPIPWKEMALDDSWNLSENCGDTYDTYCNKPKDIINNIDIVMMGTGYTEGCIPSDGSWSRVPVLIDLSNGDKLYCITLVWHNK